MKRAFEVSIPMTVYIRIKKLLSKTSLTYENLCP